MRFLRMLSNSLAGGALGAAYFTILFLQLNPQVPLWPQSVLPVYVTLLGFYGVHFAALFYGLIVVRQIVATDMLSPGWLSVRLLAWLGAAAALLVAALMWLNLRGFAPMLDDAAARSMAAGAVTLTLGGVALAVIAIGHDSFGRRGSPVSGAMLALTAAATVVAPLAVRGEGSLPALEARRLDVGPTALSPSGPRIVMLAVDGASLEYIADAAAQGRLPNFGRMLDRGAALHLATVRPTQPAPVWATVATGKFGPVNGVRSAATYALRAGSSAFDLLPDLCFSRGLVHLGFLRETPQTSAALRARPFWEIASRAGIPVGVIGWPLTYPASPVRGFVVSPRLNLDVSAALDVRVEDAKAVYPDDVMPLVRRAIETARTPVALPPSPLGSPEEDAVDDGRALGPVRRDQVMRDLAAELDARHQPRLLAIRFEGLDAVGHRYLRYAMPRSFGDVSDAERARFGLVLERYYAFIDGEVGARMATLEAGDLLLVVSGFGMEPVSLGKRLLARAIGDPDLSGSHERAPDGFVLAYGSSVARVKPPLGSVADVAPTVLYALGLPVGRDMDGYARADLFTTAYTSEHPITFIPTHER